MYVQNKNKETQYIFMRNDFYFIVIFIENEGKVENKFKIGTIIIIIITMIKFIKLIYK